MKNFGVNIFDISNLDGALRISFGGFWLERKGVQSVRSLLAIEVDKTSITVDALFMRFMFER